MASNNGGSEERPKSASSGEFSRVEKENLDLRSRVTDYQSYIKRIQMDSSQLKRQLQDSNVVGTAAFSHRKATSRSGRTEVRDIPDAMPKFTTTVTVHPTLEDLQNRITDATNQTIQNLQLQLETALREKEYLKETITRLNRKLDAKNAEVAKLTRIPTDSSPAAQVVKKDLEIAQLTTKVTQLNRLNQELKASLDQWQNRYEAEQERINQVSNGVAQSVRDLQKQLADLDVDGVRLKSENQQLSLENQKIRAQLFSKDQNLSIADQTATRLREEIDRKDSTITDLYNTIRQLRQQIIDVGFGQPIALPRSSSEVSLRREESPPPRRHKDRRMEETEWKIPSNRHFHSHQHGIGARSFNRYCSVCRAMFQSKNPGRMVDQTQQNLQATDFPTTSQHQPSSRIVPPKSDFIATSHYQFNRISPTAPKYSTAAIPSLLHSSEVLELRNRLRLSANEIEQLKWNNQTLESRLQRATEAHRHEIVEKDAEIRRLRSEFVDLPTNTRIERVADVQPALNDLLQKLQLADGDKMQAEQKVTQLSRLVKDLQMDQVRLQGELQHQRDLRTRQELVLSDREAQLQQLREELKAKSAESQSQQIEMMKAQGELSAIRRQFDELQTNLVRQESQLGRATDQLRKDETEKSQLNEEKRNLQRQIQEFNRLIENLNDQLVVSHSENSQLRSNISQYVRDVEIYKEKLEEKDRERDGLLTSFQEAGVQERNQTLLAQQELSQNEIADLRSQLEAVRLQLNSAQSEINSLKSERNRLITDQQEMRDQLKKGEKSLGKLRATLAESQAANDAKHEDLLKCRQLCYAFENDKLKLNQQIIQLEIELEKAKSEIRDQRAEVEILQVQLANEHSSVAQLERNLDDTRFSEALARMSNDEGFAEWNRMKERLAKYEEEVEAKSRETDQLRRQFNAATEEINSLKSQIADRS